MSSRRERRALERDVINAAREYIREVENPAPDLLHRARLRERLLHAVAILDGRTPTPKDEHKHTIACVVPGLCEHRLTWGDCAFCGRVAAPDSLPLDPEPGDVSREFFDRMRKLYGPDERLMRSIDAAEAALFSRNESRYREGAGE